MLVRPMVPQGGLPSRRMMPGDTLVSMQSLTPGAIATAGAGTWTGAAMASGIIRRTGPVGGYTDTTDTAQNIIAALLGNDNAADVVPGTSWRLLFLNTVAQAHTFAAGRGVVSGTGTLTTAATKVHDYLLTILNATPELTLMGTFGNGALPVVFTLPPGVVAFPFPAAGNLLGILITPGMLVTDNTTGGNITAGTKIQQVTQGQGGIIGITLDTVSAGASAAAPGDSLTFSPVIQIDSLATITATAF